MCTLLHLHLPGQLRGDLEEHVVGQHVVGALVLQPPDLRGRGVAGALDAGDI